MPPIAAIRGIVTPGRGEAGGFVALPWVGECLERQAGFRPFPGTLNLRLRDPASLARWRRLRRVPGFLLDAGGPAFCSAAAHRVTLPGGIPGVVVVPHVTSYPEDLVEVVARVRLRDALALRDGDELEVRFEGPGPGEAPRAAGCVLFDLEGTLVDFQWNLEEAEDRLRSAASAVLGCPAEAFAGLNYAAIYRAGRERAPDAATLRRLTRALEPIYDRYDLDAAGRWALRPGAEEVLRALAERGVPRALVTNIGRTAATQALARLGIKALLPVVVTRNDVTHLKPAPEGLVRALEALGVPPDAALMVGDSLSDLGAARAAGTRVAIVLGGETPEPEIRRAGPDYLLSGLEELLPLVDPA